MAFRPDQFGFEFNGIAGGLLRVGFYRAPAGESRANILTAGYFYDGLSRGLKEGDLIVVVFDTGGDEETATFRVTAVNANGSISVVATSNDLSDALNDLTGTGFISRVADADLQTRTLTAPAAGLTIANPAGIAGNPTFALANDLAALEGLSTTGLVNRTADGVMSTKTAPAGTVVGTTDNQALTTKTINASSNTITNITLAMLAAGVADTDITLAANSDLRVPTQKAIKAYVDVKANYFASRAAAIAATIPASATFLTLGGRDLPSDGGHAFYFKRATAGSSKPWQFQSADGAWWELSPDDRVNVRQFGAKSDVVVNTSGVITSVGTDNLAFFEDAAEFCRTNGKTLYIPGGKWRLSDTWTIDLSTDQAGVLWYDHRFRVEGDGKRATYLFWDAGNNDGIVISGTAVASLENASQEALIGVCLIKLDGLGVGLTLNDHFHVQARDVFIIGWNFGLEMFDVHESTLTEFIIMFNNNGVFVQKDDFTQPNLLTMVNCTIANNTNYGMNLIDVSEFKMISGSVESNGFTGVNDAIRWGVRVATDLVPIEGTCAATFDGVRFEGNCGNTHADIYYVNGVYDMVLNVLNCDFNRDGNFGGAATRWCKNNIKIDTTGVFRHHVNIIGNGFKGFNIYTPSALRPYVGVVDDTQNIYFYAAGNHFDSTTETPDFGALGCNRGPEVATSAWGIASDAIGTMTAAHSTANVLSCTKNSTGNYTVVFKKVLTQSFYHISFTPFLSVIRQWSVLTISQSDFTVQFWDNAGLAADTQFSFSVTGGGHT